MTFKLFLERKEFSCLLIKLPRDLSKDVVNWANNNLHEEDIIKQEDEPHITLLYGIHSKNIEEIKPYIENTRIFDIKLGTMSYFKNDNDVLYISCISPYLEELNSILKSNLEYTNNHEPFQPHVTIAYLQKGCADRYLADNTFTNKSFTAINVELSTPDGMNKKIQLKT